MSTQKCNEGQDSAEVTRKGNQHRPKPSARIVPVNLKNVKLLLGDFDDAWRAYQKHERGVTNLLDFLAWFHEELAAAGAFGQTGEVRL